MGSLHQELLAFWQEAGLAQQQLLEVLVLLEQPQWARLSLLVLG
jgi:hypothetical protein